MSSRQIRPRSWRENKQEALGHAYDMLNVVNSMDNFQLDRDPEFDYLRKAEDMIFEANQLRAKTAMQPSVVKQGRVKDPKVNVINLRDLTYKPNSKKKIQPKKQAGGNNRLRAFINAIAGQESGGNYQAVNADSGAAGKYQIMPANFVGEGGWDHDALGRDITLQFYLNHPKVQEKIARNKLREYFKEYGARGAASAWYSGDPNKWRNTASQGSYPSIAQYVEDIIRRMGG